MTETQVFLQIPLNGGPIWKESHIIMPLMNENLKLFISLFVVVYNVLIFNRLTDEYLPPTSHSRLFEKMWVSLWFVLFLGFFIIASDVSTAESKVEVV